MVPLSSAARKLTSRISTKFMAASLAVSILFVSLAIYSVEVGRRSLEESVGVESVEMARQFAQSVDRGIYSKLHEIILISSGRTPTLFVEQSNAEFDAMDDVESYIDDRDAIWTSVPDDETDAFMDGIMANNLSLDVSSRLEEHYIREHGIDVYGEVLITNKYGAIVAMTSRSTDYRQDDESWWQMARDEGHFVGDLEYDESARLYGIPVCTSMHDYDGNFIGVVKAVVGAAEVISEAQFETHVFETTEVDILTSDLRLVYATHAYTPLEDMSEVSYVQSIEGVSGFYWSEEGARDRIYAFSVSPGYIEYEGSSWIFLMSHDEEEVLGTTISLRTDILVVSTVLLIGLIAVSLALSNSVAVPIMRLKQATRRMSEGHLHERVDIKNRDELGELASAFNNMVSELESLYENLEDKVEERTKELETANAKLNILGSITRHDALNQLSVLRGWLSVLEETQSNEKTAQFFEKMKLSCDTLEAQLKFTGMYEKVGVTRPLWMDVKMSLDTSMPGVDLKGAQLVNQLHGLEVFADPMFPRVLRNLAENAVKHGKTTTKISFTYHETDDGLIITVEDDGVGVPQERKARLFDRERDRTTGRAGFGLYLSRAILSITDMKISEVGDPGKGARFEILVPKGRYHVLEFSYTAPEE